MNILQLVSYIYQRFLLMIELKNNNKIFFFSNDYLKYEIFKNPYK